VSRLFGDEEGLLLSLRQRWMTMLVAKLDQAAHEDNPAEKARADLVARAARTARVGRDRGPAVAVGAGPVSRRAPGHGILGSTSSPLTVA